MLEEGLQQGVTRPPSRQVMANWCTEALSELTTTTIKNSWGHGAYSYFPNEQKVEENEGEGGLSDIMAELSMEEEQEEEVPCFNFLYLLLWSREFFLCKRTVRSCCDAM